MGDKKKDLIPILAIALFLVIIIILCVVRLGERKKNESRQDAAVSESVEMIYAQEATAESGEVSLERKESASVASEEESTETETESQTVSTQEESVENQLPAVVFTYHVAEAGRENPRTALNVLTPPVIPELGRPGMAHETIFRAAVSQAKPEPKATLLYDAETFAEKLKGFCRVYLLDAALLKEFAANAGCKLHPGDAALLEPARFGGGAQVFPYHPSVKEREKALDELTLTVYTYPRGKAWDFGHVEFLSAARENLLHETSKAVEASKAVSDEWAQKFAQLDASYKAELAKKEGELAALRKQIDRLRAYETQIEKEKEQLAQTLEQERQNCKLQLQARDGEVAYLNRKLTRPQNHTDVVEWARQTFADRLIMHKRTETLMDKKTAWGVDLGLLCDALDFLATDYWDYRFDKLPVDEMNRRCSAKYGRPFDVRKLGDMTIEFTPSEYKVKYKMTGTEKAPAPRRPASTP